MAQIHVCPVLQANQQQHTLILLQSTADKATRTWLDSTTVSKAMGGGAASASP